MKKYLLGFLLAFITVGLVACGGGSNSPKDVAEGFTTALYQGDMDKAMTYVYINDEARAQMSADELKSKLTLMAGDVKRKTAEHGGLDAVKATDANLNEDGKSARVNLDVTYKDGTKKTESMPTIKDEDGDWKVDLFH